MTIAPAGEKDTIPRSAAAEFARAPVLLLDLVDHRPDGVVGADLAATARSEGVKTGRITFVLAVVAAKSVGAC